MRHGDKDHPFDKGGRFKVQEFGKAPSFFGGKVLFQSRLIFDFECIKEHFSTAPGDLELAEQAPHGVPHKHHLVKGGGGAFLFDQSFTQGVEFTAQRGTRNKDGVAAGIGESEELILPPQNGIVEKRIEHLGPGAGIGHKSMDKDHRDPFIVVRLKVIKACNAGSFGDIHRSFDMSHFLRFPHGTGEGSGKIRSKGERFFAESDLLSHPGIDVAQHG